MRLYWYLSFFVFFTAKLCVAQNYTIIDSQSKELIPFAAIEILDKNEGFFTNEEGNFFLDTTESGKIKISCLGYNNLITENKLMTDTIFLTPKLESLSEVVVYSSKKETKTIGGKSKNMAWYLGQHDQLGLFLKPQGDSKQSFIEEILIPIGKSPATTESKQKQFESVFRLHLFSNENNQPNIPLLKTPIIVHCNEKSNKLLRVDISNKNIQFANEGLFICLEMIGEIDNDGQVIEKKNFVPNFKYTDKQNKDFSSHSYFKPSNSDKWISVDKFLDKEFFLALKLVISVHEN
ncbi:carboxypeptidase-like regulatory domain-containing protein [Maribacter sp. Asnod2-G09]|uniref:carboxypeptidase-like regulatory domain-containing protein n=1 Tax=Maribacter sp. Asnod2-G09 TaxID=3160577 RepID=UPI00386E63FE